MRALAFCVSIRHAERMAELFLSHGVPCVALTSDPDSADRSTALRDLKDRRINVIFTVDLFNEGVDIPEADTILFLRPTESATVFLQQLGRGLRLHEDKPCTTVLDFVGHQHQRFRFDQRFRAMTGLSRSGLERQIENGFTSLPSGCHIQLDRETRERVLRNIKSALPSKTQELVAEYRILSGGSASYPLAEYIRETGISYDDLYRPTRTYTSLKRAAPVLPATASDLEVRISRGMVRLLHSTDEGRLESLSAMLNAESAPEISSLSLRRQRELYMLLYTLDGACTLDRLQDLVNEFWQLTNIRQELIELLRNMATHAQVGPTEIRLSNLADVPILTHGVYSQDEVMTAFGMKNPSSMRSGVFYFREHRCDVLFVTLQKTESEYSPTTRYNDYPISPTLFHWDSQNATSPESETGRRYIQHGSLGSTVLLFVRTRRTVDSSTAPYFCTGPVEYQSHESSRPMHITWKLQTPLPHRRFQEFRTVSG